MDPRDKPGDDGGVEDRLGEIVCYDWRGGLLKTIFQNLALILPPAGFKPSCFGGIVEVVEFLKSPSNSHSIFTLVGARL